MRRVVSRRDLRGAPAEPAEAELAELPPELLAVLLCHLPAAADVSRALRTCTALRACAEHALRLRAAFCGAPRALPAALPARERSWVQHLCWLERRAAFAARRAAHDGRLSASMFHSLLLAPSDAPPLDDAPIAAEAGAAAARADSASLKALWRCHSFGVGAGGRLGHGDELARDTPALVSSLGPRAVTCVASGTEFSLALGADGAVWAFGCGRFGALGHGSLGRAPLPVRVLGLGSVRVRALAAGAQHALLLTEEGAVYSWGRAAGGRLGLGGADGGGGARDAQPAEAPRAGGGGGGGGGGSAADGEAMVSALAAAGASTTPALSAAAAAAPAGEAEELQLVPARVSGFGPGPTTASACAAAAEAEAWPRAVAVAAGGSHSLVVTEGGDCYAFGSSDFGALGLGGGSARQRADLPARMRGGALAAGARVLAASAGEAHTLLLAERPDAPGAAVLACGCGWNGRLGLGDQRHREEPTLVCAGELAPIRPPGGAGAELFGAAGAPRPQPVAVSAGGAHSLVALSDGGVLSWGFGWSGQLGLGDEATVYTPTRVRELPAGARVVAVAAGGVHSLALCADGDAYSWGSGLGGRLGRGDARRCEPTPARLSRAGAGGGRA